MITFDTFPKNRIYSNKKFEEELKGYLEEKVARETLGHFLYNNIGLACEILLGIKIYPFQEIIIRGWFDHNFNYFVASRGAGKTLCAALFCILYPIFYPNSRIVLASNTFRSTRRIITQVEKFLNAKEAFLAKQCFMDNAKGKIEFAKRADEMRMDINGGAIIALPLNEKVRGTRADILICDEFLQIPEDIYKNVLMPFLTAKNNVQEQLRIDEEETARIKAGLMTEKDRTVLQSDKKIIALTSASYDFDFAYRLYKDWIENVEKGKAEKTGRTYFITRLSYMALPTSLVEKEIAEEAKAGNGEGTATFEREFMAKFSSSSDGYFNIRKLHDCTVKPGDLPCVQLKGDSDSKYILSIDPSFSDSKSSDYFAMGVFLLNGSNRTITQVHSYAKSGADLKDHIEYLYYLLTNFNIVFLIADLGGNNVNFLKTCSESSLFSKNKIDLKFIEGDFEDPDYVSQCNVARNSYNLLEKRICYRQQFSSQWIQSANEHLQSQISNSKVWFASALEANEDYFKSVIESEPPSIIKNEVASNQEAFLNYIGDQDDLIEQTKRQVALIEPSVTANGVMQFNLPAHLRKSKNPARARRDNYTCLLMACWGAKCYWDMMFKAEIKKDKEWFMPTFI